MSVELQRARKRQMFIFLLASAVCLGMIGRLYYWQIVDAYSGDQLAVKAQAQHVQNQVILAPRGLIYDTHGELLAANVVRDDVYLLPAQFATDYSANEKFQTQAEKLAQQLHEVLPSVSPDRIIKGLQSNLQTYRITEAIDPAQSEKLRSLRLRDVFLEPRTRRVYPNGELAAHVLGYTQEGKGIYGLEAKYDELLAGTPGRFQAETDLYGNPLTVGVRSGQAAVNGADISLTIDSTLQYFVENYLSDAVKKNNAQSGSALVINAKTGAVVAMGGYPSFNPNDYGAFAGQKGCLGRLDVYINPLLFCDYEPGSTMKAVTMAAALDQGLITPETTINDPGYINFSDAPQVTNWENKAYGQESMTEVLEHSANVGTAYVAHTVLGALRYYPYLERFGFGQATGLMGPEATGQYRTNESPGWTPSDLTRQAFGQSISASPLQVAMAFQAIANHGELMQPYLVQSIEEDGKQTLIQPQSKRQVISEQASAQLNQMLQQVVNKGIASGVAIPNYSIAAKTGTATTQGIADDQTEASIVGFLPASDPQFVILVKIDRPQATIYGATAAAPTWKAIAQQLILSYRISPDKAS